MTARDNVDRRQFLVACGRIGLAAAIGAIDLAGCGTTLVNKRFANPANPPRANDRPLPSVRPTPRAGLGAPGLIDNAIRAENALPGTDRWFLRGLAQTIDGFVSRASAAPGDRLSAQVDSTTAFDIEWYRLGWYGGQGGRLVRIDRGLPARPGLGPQRDPTTGRVEAPWEPSLELEVPTDWPSGMYTAVLRPIEGRASYAPFIVKGGSGTRAPILFVSAAITWQAYNPWGGANFYDANSADSPDVSDGRRAVQVSFDRPFGIGRGAGYQQHWELQFVRWQERESRDVDYAADVDLELDTGVLADRRLIVFAGHHEYWSRPMRRALEAAVAGGTSVLFLSANEINWQVRLESSPLGPGRRITCYKSARLDPFALTHPELTTCRWREPPVNDPEAPLIGQMYGHIVRRPGDWTVRGADHWLYEGTGLRDGDRLVNLVGQEYDSFFPQLANPGTVILARGPVDAVIDRDQLTGIYASPAIHTATMYTANSGATVFAAGTFQWSWAIDEFGDRSYRGSATPYDERVVRMTRNLFDRLG